MIKILECNNEPKDAPESQNLVPAGTGIYRN